MAMTFAASLEIKQRIAESHFGVLGQLTAAPIAHVRENEQTKGIQDNRKGQSDSQGESDEN